MATGKTVKQPIGNVKFVGPGASDYVKFGNKLMTTVTIIKQQPASRIKSHCYEVNNNMFVVALVFEFLVISVFLVVVVVLIVRL